MAIIDDVIGVFSPGWKAARLRSRALIMVVGGETDPDT